MLSNNYKKIRLLEKNKYILIEIVQNEKDGKIYLMKAIDKTLLKYKNESDTLKEMEILSSLNHTNLSKVIDFFFTQKTFNIIIEYDEDSEFKNKIEYNIKNHLSFEENYIWSLTIQLLNLIKFIKENKNIDFNISPSNFLLMNNGLLKLFNFGNKLILNKIEKNLNEAFDINEFNRCIPPEILNNEDENNEDSDASNIWLAGCIIYELCSLKPPFEGKNMKSSFINILKGVYKPINPKYSNDFNLLLSKMLVNDPKKRENIEELLNSEIIKKRNIEVDAGYDENNINNLFTFKKNNLKETKKQKQSINEMFQNDKYEIMKFTLSQKNSLIKYNENDIDLVETGHFGMNNIINNNIIINENNKNDDFKNKIIEAQNKKDRIIENNDFNYNNPYRNNNINIQSNQNQINNNNKLKGGNKNNNKKNNNNNNIKNNNKNNPNNFNKKINIENNNRIPNKDIGNDSNMINFFRKERQKTPVGTNQKNNFINNENRAKSKNKDNKENKIKKLVYPTKPIMNINNQYNINVMIGSKEKKMPVKKTNNNKNDVKEKQEKIKLKLGPDRKSNNNLDNKKKLPILSNIQSIQHERKVDKIINQILNIPGNKNLIYKKTNDQNIFNKKDNLHFNYGNDNFDKKILNNNFIIKKEPIIKPVQHLPNITYGKNKKIKIEYGVIKYNGKKNKKLKLKLKK